MRVQKTFAVAVVLALLAVAVPAPAESFVILTGVSFGGSADPAPPAPPETLWVYFDTRDNLLWALKCDREHRTLRLCLRMRQAGTYRVTGRLLGQGTVQVATVERLGD